MPLPHPPLLCALLRPGMFVSAVAHGVALAVAFHSARGVGPARAARALPGVEFAADDVGSPAEPLTEPLAELPLTLPQLHVQAPAMQADEPVSPAPEAAPDPLETAQRDLQELQGVLAAPRPPLPPADLPSWVHARARRVAVELRPPPVQVSAPPAAAAPADPDRGAPGRAFAPPRPLASNRPPVYPYEARARGLEGVAVFLVTLRADGTVGALRLERSSGHAALDSAAYEAVRGWGFSVQPGGASGSRTLRVPIAFRLG